MLSLDAAFDRIGSAFHALGYAATDVDAARRLGKPPGRLHAAEPPVRICSYGRARLLTVQVKVDGEWVDFAKRGVGPEGLDESAVEALVHKVRDEVDETSSDARIGLREHLRGARSPRASASASSSSSRSGRRGAPSGARSPTARSSASSATSSARAPRGSSADGSAGPRAPRLARAAVYCVAGIVSWMLANAIAVRAGLIRAHFEPTDLAAYLPVVGGISLLLGLLFYTYGLLQDRLRDSVERLKEAEFAEKELELARSIQQRILPPQELTGDGFRIAARNLAARFVAGDFYDFFRLADGAVGVVVADVAGKGIGASLIMATVKASLPFLAAGRSVSETLREANRRLAPRLERREFVALCYLRYEPETGAFALGNAGLPDPYLVAADGRRARSRRRARASRSACARRSRTRRSRDARRRREARPRDRRPARGARRGRRPARLRALRVAALGRARIRIRSLPPCAAPRGRDSTTTGPRSCSSGARLKREALLAALAATRRPTRGKPSRSRASAGSSPRRRIRSRATTPRATSPAAPSSRGPTARRSCSSCTASSAAGCSPAATPRSPTRRCSTRRCARRARRRARGLRGPARGRDPRRRRPPDPGARPGPGAPALRRALPARDRDRRTTVAAEDPARPMRWPSLEDAFASAWTIRSCARSEGAGAADAPAENPAAGVRPWRSRDSRREPGGAATTRRERAGTSATGRRSRRRSRRSPWRG